jgi:hypothetical protein
MNTENNNQNNKPASAQPVRQNALDPLRPVLVQPYLGLLSTGHIKTVSAVFSAFGAEVKVRAGEKLVAACAMVGVTLDPSQDYPCGEIKAAAEAAGLVGKKAKKASGSTAEKTSPLPEKTLCVRDFTEEGIKKLGARARAVAEKVGGAGLVSRVRSAKHYDGKETISFQAWWKACQGDARLAALTTPSEVAKFDVAGAAKAILAMEGLQECPFRETATFLPAKKAEEKEGGIAVPSPSGEGTGGSA